MKYKRQFMTLSQTGDIISNEIKLKKNLIENILQQLHFIFVLTDFFAERHKTFLSLLIYGGVFSLHILTFFQQTGYFQQIIAPSLLTLTINFCCGQTRNLLMNPLCPLPMLVTFPSLQFQTLMSLSSPPVTKH